MRTPLTDMLGIDVPLAAFSHCRDVVAAVTNAGGIGVLGATSFTPDALELELRWLDEPPVAAPTGSICSPRRDSLCATRALSSCLI